MAMMTGRVLLVCALCVLWCGACSGRFGGEETVGLGSDGPLPKSTQLETSPLISQDIKDNAPVVKGNLPSALSTPREERDDVEGDGDDGEGTKDEGEKTRTERQGSEGGTAAIVLDSREEILSGNEQENHQSIVPAEGISSSNSQESNANPLQTEVEEKKETDKNTPTVENTPTPVDGENTLPPGVAEGNRPPPPEDGVDSREQDGEDTTSEGEKNVPSPETAATPQDHRDEGSEETGEGTKATTVTANTTDTTNTQNSDGSTAVSHTTSPLLLLLVVACAAAAAVVAA
ncbi:Mucin-associated surface protein (MASP) [Trypanosoma cruzi]|uniref:Mucin-associated surface protein (MASP), putative n=2 Tax=Trypanosoma cruzi TaxID=5693 RepID=Q4D1C6_TRYCC|nr:mucin-associated surface protein (MASP), putative [Trypanosoma cruzi]EAN86329.1 mucin-associated surface protein (MASP), putative [Trypanosoma cruzi]PWV15251.1 Mucin-associated surface protein (MASP) [Trypanosoma cruzi]RNC38687.1 mucin-associated surface protein (MASP) [Trypanosoma cruzi]|eukprot:XP_808180.1 mucin-associated surface protein (MASP) [Trypanosoma cruzi strain CL Brener]